jgi:outer membrane protein assembly factor BamB
MSSPDAQAAGSLARDAASLVFVGFNSRVVALDRDNGEVVWKWKSPKGTGIPVVLLDGDRLIVSVQGYTHCLEPSTGSEMWSNPLKGLGMGVPCLASARGNTTPQLYAVLAQYEQDQAAAAHASTT